MHRWDRERWLQMALRKRNALLGALSKQPGMASSLADHDRAERRAARLVG